MRKELLRGRYHFSRDEHCFTLYRKVKIKDKMSVNYGEETDKLVGYYPGLKGMLNKIIFLELIEKGTINDLLEDLRKISSNIRKLVEGEFYEK